MAATGLRSVRIAKELGMRVHANDLLTADNIRENAELNKVVLKVTDLDANHLLYINKDQNSIIDLDPFGSSIPFLHSALAAKPDILALTFTDLELLC